MKKTVLAVAVGAALAAAGVAQAAVTVYGQAHVSIDGIDNGTDDSMFVSSNESRIGFKATEEFEGGMKANVLFEQGVNMDNETGSMTIWDRDKFVNLQGGFGTFQLGYFNTPHKMVGRKTDLFGGQVGDSRNIITEGNDLRMDDGIMYVSPSFGGVTISALFAPEDGRDNSRAFNLAVEWKNDQHYVGVSSETLTDCKVSSSATCTSLESQGSFRVGYSGSFGAVKVNALVASVANAGGVEDKNRTAFGIGAGFKMGAGTIKGQYYSTPEYSDFGDDQEATLIALGYDHAMSKTTTVYFAYAVVDNGDAATKSAAAAGHNNHATGAYRSGTAGEQASSYSFGMIHNF